MHNRVIPGFQALRQARAPVAGLEHATKESLQISGNIPPYIRKPANGQTRYPEPEKPMTIQCEADGVTPVTYSWFRNETIRHMKVKKGEKANIPCGEVPDTIPPYNKRWYHGQNSSELRTNDRIGTDSQGTLHYAYTLLSDNRSYKCGLVPTKGSVSNIILFNELHLEVEDSTEAGNFPPNKEYVTEGAKAIIGKPFIFDCFFSGNPAPQIKWINNTNHDITPSDSRYDIMNDGRQLKIYEVRQEDEGTFKCTAENIRARKEANIFLNVTSPPWRTAESLRPHTKINQRDFTLTCKAQAASRERLETPIWYRNGEELRRGTRSWMVGIHSSDYFWYRDMKLDIGIHSPDYFWYRDKKLVDSIIITKRPPDVIKVTANSTEHDITVLATGDSCCNINRLYSFNNTQLTEAALSKPPFRTNKADQTVTFVPSSVSREDLERWIGTYTCRMSNQHQHEDIHFQISYTSDPSPILAKESTVGLWWIGVICGVLAIIITIIVVFVIYKSNYPGDTYQLEKTELKHNLNPQEDLLNQSFQEI
ncbi:neural cell adhesion molecule l1 [Plakobranchus ocellatus]|uniref:Neural cell adhesion molecule l1 n=1 Tax=Plakobranchus ocellatus TaxID=259542 RepID=A0AAV4BAJ3_9GAST|nr:neural cell adhesion molecule l1 [Plakobranchus ocellatus]